MTAVKSKSKTPSSKRPPPEAEEAAVQADAGPDRSDRFPIVGIGASAGGLEAATTMFKELSPIPGDGLCPGASPGPRPGECGDRNIGSCYPDASGAGGRGHAGYARSCLRDPAQLRNDDRGMGAASGEPSGAEVLQYNDRYFPAVAGRGARKRRHRRDPFRNRVRRHSWPCGHQRGSGHHLRPGANFGQIRWHAGERDRVRLCRFCDDTRGDSAGDRSHPPSSLYRRRAQAGTNAVRRRRKRSGSDLSLAATEDQGRFFGIQIAYDRAPYPAPHGTAKNRETQGLRRSPAARTARK